MARCPVPCCSGVVPEKSIFCPDHYFAVPRHEHSFLARISYRARNARTQDEQTHLEGQLEGYVAQAVRNLENKGKVTGR